MADEEWKAWLGKLDSAAIADAARRQGCPPRYMDAGIKPVWDGARILASAYTVRLIPGQGVWSASWDAMPHGSVLVVDARGRTDAIVWGELLSAEAARRGLVGAVVDGAVRDMAGVRDWLPSLRACGSARRRALARHRRNADPCDCRKG